MCESDLKNYNGCMEILAGLSAGPISRLKKTWALLKEKYVKLFQELNSLMDNNFKLLREGLSKVSPPCIPYLGNCDGRYFAQYARRLLE